MLAHYPDPARPAPGFLEATGGALLIGRVLPFCGLGEELLEVWDRWAQLAGDGLTVVPAHDLSRFAEYAGLRGWFRIVIGAPVAIVHAEQGPSPGFDHRAITDAAGRASELLDVAKIDALCELLGASDARSFATQRTRALLVPFGPIASAHLAYGVLAPPLELPPAGRARVRGTDMQQRPHPLSVHGCVVASACDWDIAEPELGIEAHAARASVEAAYHLVARYG